MHKDLSMYFGLATSILYIFALIGMFIAMLVIHRLISEEKKRDRKAMRGEPNFKRFGKFQGQDFYQHPFSKCKRRNLFFNSIQFDK